MKILIILFFILAPSAFAVQIGSFNYTEEEIAKMHTNLSLWRDFAAVSNSVPAEEAIPKLVRGLMATTKTSIYVVGDREGVRRALQAALVAIPGHAEYYETLIKDAYDKYGNKPQNSQADHREHYESIQEEAFMALQEMPSVEAIRVLGDFLSDDRGGQKHEENPASGVTVIWAPPRNCDKAVIALFKLVANPPLPDKGHQPFVDVSAWQTWYQQVKEGRRTVQFKGDPQIYSFQGPVREVRNPDIPRATKRPEITEKTFVPAPKEQLRRIMPWLAGAFFALAALFFYLCRRVKPAS